MFSGLFSATLKAEFSNFTASKFSGHDHFCGASFELFGQKFGILRTEKIDSKIKRIHFLRYNLCSCSINAFYVTDKFFLHTLSVLVWPIH
jgi:hypothetical protein